MDRPYVEILEQPKANSLRYDSIGGQRPNQKSEAEFLDKIQTEVLRVCLLGIQSPLQLRLGISISSNSGNLLQLLLWRKKEYDRKPYHTETSFKL